MLADNKVGKGGEQQYGDKQSAGFVVKKQTHQKQIRISQARLFIDEAIENQHYGKESPEEKLRKNKWSIVVIGKDAQQIFTAKKPGNPIRYVINVFQAFFKLCYFEACDSLAGLLLFR